jgi:hypothetical protein
MDGDPKAYLTDNPAIHGAGNPTVDGLGEERVHGNCAKVPVARRKTEKEK